MSQFDPLAILGALERHRVAYVLVGELAGVLHGSDLSATRVEIAPSLRPENLKRLERALEDVEVTPKRRAQLWTLASESASISLTSSKGVLTLTPTPSGTKGYEDLRRASSREALGEGIRAQVVSAPDLLRSVSAQGTDVTLEHRLRRLIDLERRLTPEI